jgi:hypothetical protein
MNKFIIVVVFLLSVISFYLFFETPSNSHNTNTNQNEQTIKKEEVVITTTASESKKIDNNTKKEIQTKQTETITKKEVKNRLVEENDNNVNENALFHKKMGDIEISLNSDEQQIDLDDTPNNGELATPKFPSLLNVQIDKKPLLIQLPPNKNLILTLKNKNGVQIKYEIDTTMIGNGKMVNVGEITPKNFNTAKSQTEIENSSEIQDNIDTKIEEAKTDNNPNNSIVPPAPPPL